VTKNGSHPRKNISLEGKKKKNKEKNVAEKSELIEITYPQNGRCTARSSIDRQERQRKKKTITWFRGQTHSFQKRDKQTGGGDRKAGKKLWTEYKKKTGSQHK